MAAALVTVPLATLGLAPVAPTVPDPRHGRTLRKLQRLIPPPAPTSGWLYCRLRVEAEWLGVVQDSQNSEAERMLLPGATMVRVDDQAAEWDIPEYLWRLAPTNEPGARDLWVDAWGQALAVPRSDATEDDTRYSLRMLSELTRPGTVNHGMAGVIDDALGVQGTLVLETSEYFRPYRYNEGHRCGHGIRANWAFAVPAGGWWATFVVVLAQAPTAAQRSKVRQVVARVKAAGTRLLYVFGTSPAPLPSEPGMPSSVSMTVTDDSPTGTPTFLTVSQPEAHPDGVSLVGEA